MYHHSVRTSTVLLSRHGQQTCKAVTSSDRDASTLASFFSISSFSFCASLRPNIYAVIHRHEFIFTNKLFSKPAMQMGRTSLPIWSTYMPKDVVLPFKE